MTRHHRIPLLLMVIALPAFLPLAANAAEPCCGITGIAENGRVTARDAGTRQTLVFQVDDPALLGSLRIGQKVYADFGTQKVSINYLEPCCNIVSGAAGKVAKAIPAVQKPTVHGAEPCCNVVANVALKGRMGRLVLAFPEGASAASTRVRIGTASADGSVSDEYGSQTLDLMPGNYTVEISGATLKNVAVKSGHDTRVRVGALRLSAGASTRVQTYEPISGKLLTDKYGAQVIGFPAGSVNVKIAGQMQAVKIEDNKVVDF